jgi:hypothetical protein
VDRVLGTYDMKTGEKHPSEPATREWTVAGKSGNTGGTATAGSASVTGEVGDGLLGGGEARLTKEGFKISSKQ